MRRSSNLLVSAFLTATLLVPGVQTGAQGGRSGDGATPGLIAAVRARDSARVSALLRAGADPDGGDAEGMRPLHHAAYCGATPVASILLASGADANGTDAIGLTPLHVAAYLGEADLVRLLIDHGADVGARDRAGLTPLHCAAAGGREDVAEILLNAGADARVRSGGDLTPAETASKNGEKKLAEFLRAAESKPIRPGAGRGRPHLYTDDDIAAVRGRSRLANEDQVSPRAPVRQVRPGAEPKSEAGEGAVMAAAEPTEGGFGRAFNEGAWIEDIGGAIRFAKEARKPLLALFTGSDWCSWCKRLESAVLSTRMFRERVRGKFVLLYVDFPRRKPVSKEVLAERRRFAEKYGISGYPTLVIFSNGDRLLDRIGGFPAGTDAEGYIARIEAIASR